MINVCIGMYTCSINKYTINYNRNKTGAPNNIVNSGRIFHVRINSNNIYLRGMSSERHRSNIYTEYILSDFCVHTLGREIQN